MRLSSAAALALLAAGSAGAQGVAADPAVTSPEKPAGVFFRSETPVDVTLTTNIRQLRGDKSDKAPWRWATLSYVDSAGKTVTVPVQTRTRGIWRLRTCHFPPTRLNLAKKNTAGTVFEGLDKPKMVNYCRDTDMYEAYILQEVQLYRIYNLLTPYSHKARLLRTTYADSATGKVHAKRHSFVIEEPEAVAKRMSGRILPQKGAGPSDLEEFYSALTGLFQYMIGNTDWSISGLHNMELMGREDMSIVPIAYDFDFAGAVNATYATPDPKLGIIGVRQRLYRGYCTEPEQVQKAIDVFNAKKDAIYALYRDDIGKLLHGRTVRETLAYYDDFYRIINDRGVVKELIQNQCIGRRR